jgi:hypothetical protein
MLYRTNVALTIKGDRVVAGSEIELNEQQVQRFDPADITPVSAIPAPDPEIALADIPLEEMTYEQLKARAKELDLSASGSKADILERITLHLQEIVENEMEDFEVTEDYLAAHPDLAERGVMAGDIIKVPKQPTVE